jgi:hypothetical protein
MKKAEMSMSVIIAAAIALLILIILAVLILRAGTGVTTGTGCTGVGGVCAESCSDEDLEGFYVENAGNSGKAGGCPTSKPACCVKIGIGPAEE